MRLIVIVLAACGSAAAPVAPAPPLRPAVPASVSCGDAGVMLRGTVKDPKKAGPAKEAAIASACLFDKWAREVLDCVGSQPDRQACLDKLTALQRAGLTKKLVAWAELYAEADQPSPDVDPEVDP